jgi:glutamate/aspartate transport system substrate-binding protein
MRISAVVGLLSMLLASAGCASTQGGQAGPGTGATLDRIKATKTVTFGYRDSSMPFSFMGTDQKPAGYSVDLCNRVADDLKRDLQMPDLAVKWAPVTVENRVASVQNGTIDLECGSTTNTLSRQAQADFSLTTFVTGASLLTLKETVTANLSGLRIAVIPGTTTEGAVKDAMD